jgi:hypothetical protein
MPGKKMHAMSKNRSLRMALVILLMPLLSWAADRPLFTFDQGFDPKSVQSRDAQIAIVKSADGYALRVNTGRNLAWPGVMLPAVGGRWNLAAYAVVLMRVKNTGTTPVTVHCRVDNPGADGKKHCVTKSLNLDPGQTNTLKVPLRREIGSTMNGELFGMRGYPMAAGGPDDLDAKNVTKILIFVSQSNEEKSFEVADIRASDTYTPPTAWVTDAQRFFPFIDTFGQYKHKEWPGKVHSLTELRQRRMAEAAELVAHPGPTGWDKYGGLGSGPKLKATGFFRTEKVDGKWWLVNPAGHLFWSHGITCVRISDTTPIEERDTWFEDLPGDQKDYREFLSTSSALKGHYAGRSIKSFAFAGANIKRKYEGDWKQVYADTAHKRLRSWGLNTIANWSDSKIYLMRRTPYTDNLNSRGAKMIEGSEGYWGKFPDVFDPSFVATLRRDMENKKHESANDPWCIGYFSDNEMSWGDETSLALSVLRSPAQQVAKREFVRDLKAKYSNITRLNYSWGTNHTSWEALLENRTVPDKAKARDDLIAFYNRLSETYFRTVRDIIKAVAPNQLYLGCRFSEVNDNVARAAGTYCDVVSYNLYRRNIADFIYPGGDKPLIVGEFHFGALDRGQFHAGLVPVENQQDRAKAYRDYVTGALSHPQLVGTHWFQWQDQPTTGRVHDEENYQIGFLDVADTPYKETIAASSCIGKDLYETRLGITGSWKAKETEESPLK